MEEKKSSKLKLTHCNQWSFLTISSCDRTADTKGFHSARPKDHNVGNRQGPLCMIKVLMLMLKSRTVTQMNVGDTL